MAKCCGKITVYRPKSATAGLETLWWNATDERPHLDPLAWSGPADKNGFPLPTIDPPDFVVVNNNTSISDSNSGANASRYGVARGWLMLPETATHVIEINANTGELGMVLLSDCCSSVFYEALGGNHATNTTTADRTIMDSTPVNGGPLEVYSPQSDATAFQGWQFMYSNTGPEGPWIVAPKQVERPDYDCEIIKQCDLSKYGADGWSLKKPPECCSARYISSGNFDPAELLSDATPVPINPAQGALTTGVAGTSSEAARADHTHELTLQANPNDPVITAITSSGSVMNNVIIQDRVPKPAGFAWQFSADWNVRAGNGWNRMVVPVIAGFSQPEIKGVGTYRPTSNSPQNDDGNFGASPRGPFMGKEAQEYRSTRQIYLGHFRRDNDYRKLVDFWVEYTRN